MAVLNIRNLPDAIHAKLRMRAARAGRSMEAEARSILTEACMEGEKEWSASSLQDWVDDLYAGVKPGNVADGLIAERRQEAAGE
jgi:hypothetical protein